MHDLLHLKEVSDSKIHDEPPSNSGSDLCVLSGKTLLHDTLADHVTMGKQSLQEMTETGMCIPLFSPPRMTTN